jgi:hypothetical protein
MFLAKGDGLNPTVAGHIFTRTRPEIDVYGSHDYDQNPATFRARQTVQRQGVPQWRDRDQSIAYRGHPYFVSEFGGIGGLTPKGGLWGYGTRQSLGEFYTR